MLKKVLITILILAILAAGVAVAVFLFCGGDETGNGETGGTDTPAQPLDPVHGGEIVLSMSSTDIWCPLITTNESHIQIFNLIFDSLVNVQADMTPAPNLAESWTVSSDARTWTLTLNPNVTWHDGEPFIARDVEFTVNSIRAIGRNGVYYQNIENISRVTVVDEHTVEFRLSHARSNFVNLLYFPIIRHNAARHNSQTYVPLGTGAFSYYPPLDYETLILTKNPNWHGGDIYVDRVRVALLPPDQNAAPFMFSALEIDMLVSHDVHWGRTVSTAQVGYVEIPTNRFNFLGFNHANPVLRELPVRQAIAHSINYQAIVRNVLLSRAVPSFTPVNPNWKLHDSRIDVPEFSPQRARQILIDDGWEFDGEGFTKRIGGVNRRLQFDILVNEDNPVREQIAVSIQRNLAEAGILVNVQSVPFSEYTSNIANRRFDMFLGEYNILADLNFDFMLNVNSNPFGLQDWEFNRLLSDAQTATEEIDIATAYNALQQHIHDTLPFIGLYYKNFTLLYNPRVNGIPTPLFHNAFGGVGNLWVGE